MLERAAAARLLACYWELVTLGTDDPKAPEEIHYYLLIPLFGIYLIGGATYTFATHSWFAGFPIQLDLLNLLPYGLYIEAGMAGVLGALCVCAPFLKPQSRN